MKRSEAKKIVLESSGDPGSDEEFFSLTRFQQMAFTNSVSR